ncbi:MAG: phosphoribosyltransferase regulatory subunit [Rickettsiaceae bacterium]|jgi:ATP phosphoribosyltransferase regulatory subunit|nr:phosphoribosyltransferase regulatory subunit [Rickettsiaceae bacterium]
MVKEMNIGLLPAGFHDLLFPEAGRQADIVAKISAYFESFGYFLINPPVIEFEDSLFAGAGKALENSTFRLMDPLSHNMMGVRADITVQVARVATTRLKNEPGPIRLAYAGDVFRVKGEGLHAERQFTQAGIELIGINNAYADAEVVLLALEALGQVGVKDLCIDFNIPGLAEIVLQDLKIEDKEPLLVAIRKKDAGAITKQLGKKGELLIKLIDIGITPQQLLKLKLSKKAGALCARMCEVIDIVASKKKDVNISIDPISATNFSYHTDIGFSIFSKKAKDELARGGRYIADGDVEGIGVTLYVNELFRILPKAVKKEKVFVPQDADDKDVEQIRKSGKVIIRALGKHKSNATEAARLGCNFVLQKGKLEKI